MGSDQVPEITPVEFLGRPKPLADPSRIGRSFNGSRKIRLGDVDPQGRLRFDGLTRYTQDVSNDDTSEAELPDSPGWVVRSTVVDELVPGSLGETLKFTTFCSGLGKRWAERRLTVSGDHGARYEVATVWVCVDASSGQPVNLTDQFLDIYGPPAAGRRASARLENPKLVDAQAQGAAVKTESWQLRRVDFDTLGHVNNAAYWAAAEQWMGPFGRPRRARMEYGTGVSFAPEITIARYATDDVLVLWWQQDGTSAPAATTAVFPLPAGLY